jgi:[ribosomal protein S5]-alanine N-acetyltransferase
MNFLGKNIYIRQLEVSDATAALELQIRNKEFFQAYSPMRIDGFYTVQGQTNVIEANIAQSQNNSKYTFGIFLNDTDELIGSVSLSEILRGPLQSCYIGYYLDQQQNGKGYMTEAVILAVDFAFKELELHRIEAGVMPHNIGSMKVREKAGFHKEGIAVKSVKINGKWEDHQILAIVAAD